MSIPHDHEFQIGDEFTDGTKVIGVHEGVLWLYLRGRFTSPERSVREAYTLKPPAPTVVERKVILRSATGTLYFDVHAFARGVGTLTSWSDGTVTWEAAE